MQSIKPYMRQVGIPNAEAGVISAAEYAEEMEYKFTSQGYEAHSTHYLGEVRDASGNVLGYKMFIFFVKSDAPAEKRKTLKEA